MLDFIRDRHEDYEEIEIRVWIADDGRCRYVVTIDDAESCPMFKAEWGYFGWPTDSIDGDFPTLRQAQLALSAIAKARAN